MNDNFNILDYLDEDETTEASSDAIMAKGRTAKQELTKNVDPYAFVSSYARDLRDAFSSLEAFKALYEKNTQPISPVSKTQARVEAMQNLATAADVTAAEERAALDQDRRLTTPNIQSSPRPQARPTPSQAFSEGLMSSPRPQARPELEDMPVATQQSTGLMAKPDTAPSDVPSKTFETGLIVSQGTRVDFEPSEDMFNISLDYNTAPNASGTEVIIPDNASDEVRAAAEKFNDLVVQFAAKNGYEGYSNRGVKTRSENKRGIQNTIHVEPFFKQDAKMEQIINDNMDEFALLYKEAFGDLSARMVAPHGTVNKKGIQDKGATSDTFGTELDFGNAIISRLMGQ